MADGAGVPGVRMVADGAWVRVDIATNQEQCQDKETPKGGPVNKKRIHPVVTGQRGGGGGQRKNSPRQWGRLFSRAPREICPAISTHPHWGGDCTTTLRWQDVGAVSEQAKNLQTEPFWLLLTSPRLSTRSGTLLFFTNSSCSNSSRSNSPLASFFGCAPSFLIIELKSRLVVPTAAPSASDVGSHRARYLVQSSSFCFLMTSLRIYLGVPMPPCMLTIWPSGPPPQTRSKPPLLSNPPSLS